MCEWLVGDLISVIVPFLSVRDRILFTRINKTWYQTIHMMQSMWHDVYSEVYQFDRIAINQENQNDDEIMNDENKDWLEELRNCFLQFPKKIKIETKLENSDQLISSKEFDSSCYGNVNLVFPWSEHILEDKIEKYQMALELDESYESFEFQEYSTYFQFNFDIRAQYDSIRNWNGANTAHSMMMNIYTCCLFYEMMSLGHYVPDLLQDKARINELEHEEVESLVPLAPLLLSLIKGENLWSIIDTPYLNIAPNFDGPSCSWINSYLFSEILDSMWLEAGEDDEQLKPLAENKLRAFGRVNGQHPFFYFDAGGSVDEVIHATFEVLLPSEAFAMVHDNTKSIVKLTRKEARSFF